MTGRHGLAPQEPGSGAGSRAARPPVALTIAGSDPSGGAGIQADLKTFSALGAYGTSVITALTAQNTRGVTGVHLVPAQFVTEQLHTLVADVRIDAIKIGMLSTREVAEAVGAFLREFPCDTVVLDPVMVATSGDRLLAPDAAQAVRELLPLASLITPNLHEAADLLGVTPACDAEGLHRQAQALLGAGAQRVLVKGGHLANGASAGPQAVDVFAEPGTEQELTAPRVDTVNTHGTGCSLSSAIAALRPVSATWLEAVAEAKSWLTGALAAADVLEVGGGHGPVHHFHQLWERLPRATDPLRQ
ncbi:MAG TPA: bifunctional hydroxymethylpyrimidine kinase/phosphomethylpyrimidine kinase [Kineosporiaceae bacterium]|nr:bifunctional hydroxymethylpyrimidine kinase/phosphomethylpyrimidine kinase [Kineosporiaceae bacterium]